MIQKKLQHTYLKQFIKEPFIDEEKLFLLAYLLQDMDLTTEKKEKYIITTMLVQIALDTHDYVPTEQAHDIDEQDRIQKQLTVLAGDYYSGLYYFLLAEIGDVKMIRTLANVIKEINELKMELYYDPSTSISKSAELLGNVQSLLIKRMSTFANERELTALVGEWLLILKLTKEKNMLLLAGQAESFDVWFRAPNEQSIATKIESIDGILEQKKHILNMLLDQLPSKHAVLKKHMDLNSSLMEEG